MGIQSVLCLPVNKVRQALPEVSEETVAKVALVASLALLLVGTVAPFLLPHGSMGFYLSISLGLADFVVFVGLVVYLSHQKIPAHAKTAKEYESCVKRMPRGSQTIEDYLDKYYGENKTIVKRDEKHTEEEHMEKVKEALVGQFNTDAPRQLELRLKGEVVDQDSYPAEDKVRRVSHQSAAADVTRILMPQYLNDDLKRSLSEAKLCVNAVKEGESVSAVQYFVTFKIKDGDENIIGYIPTRTHIDLRSGNAELTWSKPVKACPTTAYFEDKKSR